jgi:hypothetical protein
MDPETEKIKRIFKDVPKDRRRGAVFDWCLAIDVDL